MSFKLPEKYQAHKQEIFKKKYIQYNGKEVHVSELKDRSITPEIKKQMRMNSYAQDDLPPKLDNKALIETVEHYVMNCSQPSYPCSTYDEALIHKLVPELIKRLKEFDDELSK